MQQLYVKFDNVDQVVDFVNILDRFDVNFDMGSGRSVVDAKSILGVAALDLTQPQRLCYDSEDEEIFSVLKPFVHQR